MKLIPTLLSATLALTLFACGGDTHQSIMEEQKEMVTEVGTILEGITDEASAKEAAKKLEGFVDDMKALKKRMEDLPKMTEEEEKKLIESSKELMEPMMKLTTEAVRLQSIPGAAEALEPIQKAMQEMGD